MTIKVKLLLVLSWIVVIGSRNNEYKSSMARRMYTQYDTSAEKLRSFRHFSDSFFSAVGSNDTGFIKAHVIFPITRSSFYIFDSNLFDKKIYSRLFLTKLNVLFPNALIKRIKKEGMFFCSTKNKPKTYQIELAENSGGIEANYNWFFIQKEGHFFFVNFKSEAG
jgi:hypothetical protein